MEFGTSVLQFLISLLVIGGCVFFFSVLVGVICAAFIWVFCLPVELIVGVATDGRKSLDMEGIFGKMFVFFSIVWAAYALVFVVRSQQDPFINDLKSMVTFGAVKAPLRQEDLPIEAVKTEIRRYSLDAVNPPKHFYVTLRDVQTGQMYESTYVSKHCNNYASNKLGAEYNLQVTTLKQGDRTWLRFDNLYAAFCQ